MMAERKWIAWMAAAAIGAALVGCQQQEGGPGGSARAPGSMKEGTAMAPSDTKSPSAQGGSQSGSTALAPLPSDKSDKSDAMAGSTPGKSSGNDTETSKPKGSS